jgi:hypothetical protein
LNLLIGCISGDGRLQRLGDVGGIHLSGDDRVDDKTADVRRQTGQDDVSGTLGSCDFADDRLRGDGEGVGVLGFVCRIELRLGGHRQLHRLGRGQVGPALDEPIPDALIEVGPHRTQHEHAQEHRRRHDAELQRPPPCMHDPRYRRRSDDSSIARLRPDRPEHRFTE